MKVKTLLKFCRGAVVAAVALAGSAALAAETLTMSVWLPPAHPLVSDVLMPMVKEIETATDGDVTVKVLPAPLGPPGAHYDLAANGVADIVMGVQNYTAGRFRTSELAEMPFLGDDTVARSLAYWKVFNDTLSKANEYERVKVLAVFTHGPGEAFSKEKPLTASDAFDGMKIRVGGGMAHDVAVAVGGVPIEGPASKAYELLSQGVADGLFFPFESVESFGLLPLMHKGMTVPGGLYSTSMFIVMNKAKWDRLSPEDQAAIENVTGEHLITRAGEMWERVDDQAREAMKGKIDVSAATAEQMEFLHSRLDPLIEKKLADISEATGIDAKAAFAEMQAEIAAAAK
ncbi:TRAP transporter substrate-binding protein [Martelella lutilitoris]|uniref:TRAP transporter substrate-binding protein n=1 Tax=Martelella lutilitoris TaxID=2583532 RepID=A0A5C4JSU9_9HYPH|nr:TRAP transporter substrate-binding protein [Martelella lutilitoris]TNB48525.1 TRAP transporter substrate-binding protein [Martelella lutilitoris]